MRALRLILVALTLLLTLPGSASAGALFLRGGRASVPPVATGGCVNASSGTVQRAHLLDTNSGTQEFGKTFTSRPSVQEIGVDCRAGYPIGQTFKVPGVDTLPSGASYNSGTGKITISSSGVVFDGWNLADTYLRPATGGTNAPRITNSKWRARSSGEDLWKDEGEPVTGLLEIDHSELDCNQTSRNPIWRYTSAQTQTSIHHNYIKGSCGDAVIFMSAGIASFDAQSNLVENEGTSNLYDHSDFVQFYLLWPSTAAGNVTIRYNVIVQDAADANHYPIALNSFSRHGDADTTNTLTTVTITDNVAVGYGNTGHAVGADNTYPAFTSFLQGYGRDTGSKIYGLTVSNNWVWTEAGGSYNGTNQNGYASGAWAIHSSIPYTTPGPYMLCSTISANINMRDNSSLPAMTAGSC